MHDRVPLWEGLCRAVGSHCYRKTMIKRGAINHGRRAHVEPLENKVILGFCVFCWRVCAGRAGRKVAAEMVLTSVSS